MKIRTRAQEPLTIVGLTIALLASNAWAADEKPSADRTTYDDHVVEVFRGKCFSCHSQDRKKGGLALNTYGLVLEGGSSGAVIAPGDLAGSRLWSLVNHAEEPHMPPRGGKLPDTELEILRRWIEAGAPESKTSKVVLKKPKLDLAVRTDESGRPEGPPPMPRAVDLDPVIVTDTTTAITAIATSPWAPLVAVSGQKQVLLYDLEHRELLGVLPFPEGAIHVLRFSRSGEILLAAGGRAAHSGRVVLWDLRSGRRLTSIGDEVDAVLAADISADHRLVALGGPSKKVRVYSTADGELLWEASKHTDWVMALEFSPDGVLLASGDRSSGLHVWESIGGREYLDLRGHGAAVTDVSWRVDSNLLASASEDRTVRLWEMENGAQVKSWNAHGEGTLSVDFARDGRLVTAGRDRLCRLWDANGAEQKRFTGFADLALEVAIGPANDIVIGGDWTGRVICWSVEKGEPLGEIASNPPSLASRIEASETRARATAATYEKLLAEMQALQKSLNDARQTLEAARESLAGAEATEKSSTEIVAKGRAEGESAAKDLTDALAALAARETELIALAEDTTEDAEKRRLEAKGRLDEARKTVDELQARIAGTVGQRTEGTTTLATAKIQRRAATRDIAASEARVAESEKPIAERRGALESAQKEHARDTAALARWTAARELSIARRSVDALEARSGELAAELARAEAVLAGSTATLAALRTELDADLKATEEKLAAMVETLEATRASALADGNALRSARELVTTDASDAQVATLVAALEKIAAASEAPLQDLATARASAGEAARDSRGALERWQAAQREFAAAQAEHARASESSARVAGELDAARERLEAKAGAYEAAVTAARAAS